MTSVAASGLIGRRSPASRYKDLLLGRPLPTSRLVHERLRKLVALAVFSSDAISSTAYGTEQIMLVLVAAGAVATRLAFPIALAIGALLTILILSYRQTITAYPSAGGAYIVTKDNFGPRLAQVAGSALLIDYVLTVAVSVTSGVAALTTAVPPLQRFDPAAVAGRDRADRLGQPGRGAGVGPHLRGADLPVRRLVCVDAAGRPGPPAHRPPGPDPGRRRRPRCRPRRPRWALLLVLHAFASGCTALTGVEAISNGVPAFRRPEAQNARRTLIAMGAILGTPVHRGQLPGRAYPRAPLRERQPDPDRAAGQLGARHLGRPAGCSSTCSRRPPWPSWSWPPTPPMPTSPGWRRSPPADAFLPRQFTKRGHRLVFSNGILTLSVAAAAVIVAFAANYNRMLPLYAIGVFTSFTLSQAGMTRRHLRLREPGWRYGIVVNGLGALVTFVVLLDIIQTKFAAGAWMVLLALPVLVFLLGRTNQAYASASSAASRSRCQRRWRRPSPATRCWSSSTTWTGPSWAPCSTPASSTRCRSPPCTWPPTRTRPSGWPRCGPRCQLAGAAGGGPLPGPRPGRLRRTRPSTSGSGPTPRSPCCCPAGGYVGFWKRLLHDQTGRDLFPALSQLAGVTVAIVHPPLTTPTGP